ncbi:MAG: ATP-binding protein [Mycoplasmoidaceae bacterium]|nr:MAG: ATP-binding protein [Mycoplasmoidaceae bacterium]
MERFAYNLIKNWFKDNLRKPLLLKGARQVGKTWLVDEVGKKMFNNNYIKIDFMKNKDIHSFFSNVIEPDIIIHKLSLYFNKNINKDTLIFFDEIQECNDALNSLKYFNTNRNKYYIIAAGSLLGLHLNGFPVGQTNEINITPLSFDEFIYNSDEKLFDYFKGITLDKKIELPFHNKLLEYYKDYLIIGGMPEPLNEWIVNKNYEKVIKIQKEIISGYEHDFGKYNKKIDAGKILAIFRSLPSQLAKENAKFKYSIIKKGGRANDYESAMNWMVSTNIIDLTNNVSEPLAPLKASVIQNHFKAFFLDVGLIKTMAEISNEQILLNKDFRFKGALTESFVKQQLTACMNNTTFYYSIPNKIEIDFLVDIKGDIYPIEVKGGINTRSASLNKYIDTYKPRKYIRLSQNNIAINHNTIDLPLYLVSRIPYILQQETLFDD